MIPPTLGPIVSKYQFLFVGYSLSDWNVRVILSKFGRRLGAAADPSWAIQKQVPEIKQRFWRSRNVDLDEMGLDAFVAELRKLDSSAANAAD